MREKIPITSGWLEESQWRLMILISYKKLEFTISLKNTFLEKPQGGVKLTPRFFSVKIWTEYFQCCKIILKLKAFVFLYKTTCKEIHRYWYSPFGILHLVEIKMQKNSPAVFENIAVNGGVYVCKKNDRFIDFFLFFLSFFPWFLCS